MSIIVTADSSCDLKANALAPLPFELFPLSIIQNGVEYKDGVDIKPEEIYTRVQNGAPIPSTSAVNLLDYAQRFNLLSREYDAVIHISLGSAISSCFEHAQLAAQKFPNVYIVDSQNISVGSGLLVLEARRMVLEGMAPAKIAETLTELANHVEFHFLIDQLTFLHKGGRCSGIAVLGANLLKLKPCIAVQPGGALAMVKKYRNNFEKTLPAFLADRLQGREDIIPDKTMLVSTDCPAEWIALAQDEVLKHSGFLLTETIIAGCTICSHSGPRALGLAVLRK